MPKVKKGKKQYSFPILKKKEIVKCMKELQISITENDLKDPREETCKLMYAAVLEKLMGVNVLSKQIPYDKLSIFEHPSLHEQSLISVRLICEMIKFMQKTGVEDFNIADLISPQSASTIRNLSAIINFARWREQKYQIFMDRKTELHRLDTHLKAIIAENKKCADVFVQINNTNNAERPQIEGLLREIEALKQQLAREHASMEEKGQISKQIKREIMRLKTCEQERKKVLEDTIHEIHTLQTKIVKSPQRIKKELKFLSNGIQHEMVDIAGMNEWLKMESHKLKHLAQLKALIERRTQVMREIDGMQNERFTQLEQQLRQVKNERTSLEIELKADTQKHKTLAHSLADKKSEYGALQREHQSKEQEIQVKNQQIDSLKCEHSRKRIAKQTQISNLEAEIEAKKEATHNMLRESKENLQTIKGKYVQLMESVAGYHQNMMLPLQQW